MLTNVIVWYKNLYPVTQFFAVRGASLGEVLLRIEQTRWTEVKGWEPAPPGELGEAVQLVLLFGSTSLLTGKQHLAEIKKAYPDINTWPSGSKKRLPLILGRFYARNSWSPWGLRRINWQRPCISLESTRSCADSGRSPGSPTSAAFALVGVDLRRRGSPPWQVLWDDAAVLDESSSRLRPAACNSPRAPEQ